MPLIRIDTTITIVLRRMNTLLLGNKGESELFFFGVDVCVILIGVLLISDDCGMLGWLCCCCLLFECM
jgi:hypothetical protein